MTMIFTYNICEEYLINIKFTNIFDIYIFSVRMYKQAETMLYRVSDAWFVYTMVAHLALRTGGTMLSISPNIVAKTVLI